MARSSRSNAMSVLGSRPTSCVATTCPFQSFTVSSPSSDKALSAVTMRPGRQTKPLYRERPEDTETRLGAVPATRPTIAADSSFNSVIELDLLIGGGPSGRSCPLNVGAGRPPAYYPSGQASKGSVSWESDKSVDIGHLRFSLIRVSARARLFLLSAMLAASGGERCCLPLIAAGVLLLAAL